MIGKNIKDLREQKHLSLSDLARQIEISKGYLHSIENGLTDAPSVFIVARIAKLLGVTIEQLIDPDEMVMVTCPRCKGEGVVPLSTLGTSQHKGE
jgi:XRE family transcriptional regulator, master regulator for biofilm formation